VGQFERGVIIGERYRLVDEIGRGGMGAVWCAYDEVLDRLVAVKLMADTSERLSDRLRQEARAAARLNHPHITSVYDFGDAPPYIVMELLEGRTLAQRLASGPLPLPEARAVAAQVASALAAAHRRGIVHGDVKPGNVVLTPSGAKVVDFGLASRQHSTTTPTYGTPRYVAPELLANTPASPASDVYAFGVLLGQLLRTELASRCQAADPANRPTMDQVAEALGGRSDADPNGGSGGNTGNTAPLRDPTRLLDAGRTIRVDPPTRRRFALAAGALVTAGIAAWLLGTVFDEPDGERTERRQSGQPAAPARLKVQVQNEGSTDDNQVTARLDIANIGREPIELSRVEVRYWFTADDGPDEFEVWCDWAELGCEHIRQRVESVDPATDDADHVLVLRFGRNAGWLDPDESTGEIQNRLNKSDWSTFDERNDHSYAHATTYRTAPRVAGYVDGELSWGAEPR
jgi:serine/threonine protein kinase